MNTDFVNGTPSKGAGRRSRTARDFYQLGRASASLTQKSKDVEQAAQFSMIQRLKMLEDRMELMKLMSELKLRQDQMTKQALDMQVAQMMGPPPLQGGGPPFQEPPPLPMGPPPINGGMPMGPPPMPMGGGGGMPPEMPAERPQYEVAEYGAVPPMY